jgi:hypothetical protein
MAARYIYVGTRVGLLRLSLARLRLHNGAPYHPNVATQATDRATNQEHLSDLLLYSSKIQCAARSMSRTIDASPCVIAPRSWSLRLKATG